MAVKKLARSRAAVKKAAPPLGGGEGFVRLDGLEMYCVPDVDRMPPFLMSVVSDSDHWMFLSSYGGLTAGRVDEDQALFPYVTDDQLHLCHGTTGPLTLIRVQAGAKAAALWEPFTDRIKPAGVRRNLYKSVLGNIVVFEEVNPALGLTFRYRWASSEPLGFVRTATLSRHPGAPPARIEILDGLLNLLPSGIGWFTTQRFGCLLNAYTRCEADPETGLGLITMSSLMSDRAEPAEALRTTVAWATGLAPMKVILSADAVRTFREGSKVQPKDDLKGRRGAYLALAQIKLASGESRQWHIGADVRLGHLEVQRLRQKLRQPKALLNEIEASIAAGSANLLRSVAGADGLQAGSDRKATAHHFANVLFNIMRGGVFLQNYDLPAEDFTAFVRDRNKKTYAAHESYLKGLAGMINYRTLMEDLEKRGDADLLRLGLEYLPLTFSRRHGDPSRPWNRFAIHIKNPDGSRRLAYQGNWRDIFQNWEALSLSFPGFLESIIAKFVNASTVDGFNPYRMSQAGIDWEAPEPGAVWTNLGYWGDHQIIYLLKLMEHSRRYHPGLLEKLLDRPLYTYANVPYRLGPYEAILRDPHNTISYDLALAKAIDGRIKEMGSDGRLVLAPDGGVYHVTLAEKLLVAVLSKLSNLVVDGGIWMNTQRPEWNDANNALVGNGISVVTLCYLRRYLECAIDLLKQAAGRKVQASAEVVDWCEAVAQALHRHRAVLVQPAVTDEQRKIILDALGSAFSQYRQKVYPAGFSGRKTLELDGVAGLFALALDYVDHSIRANRRKDRLYHAYNLLDLSADGRAAGVGRMYEMLEGQVAALSTGVTSAEETLEILRALRASRMYRPDQDSFLLYPERALPKYLEKNVVPARAVKTSPLLAALLKAGDESVIVRDAAGQYRFSSDFRNSKDLRAALEALGKTDRWGDLVREGAPGVLETFEHIFNHRSFTGRSGTMYGYEGLGCIYWHMVAKLLLAVQENFQRSARESRSEPVLRKLAEAYYQVRAGLGFNKTTRQFGAMPTDPYSHTPGHAGAQQPGMTGQVKEEIITRMGEMGITVEGGRLVLSPLLLRRREFLKEPAAWQYVDVQGRTLALALEAGELAFTFCQVPIIYELTNGEPRLVVTLAGGMEQATAGLSLDGDLSAALFERTGKVQLIRASVPTEMLRLK
jgi:hypothetical protein